MVLDSQLAKMIDQKLELQGKGFPPEASLERAGRSLRHGGGSGSGRPGEDSNSGSLKQHSGNGAELLELDMLFDNKETMDGFLA